MPQPTINPFSIRFDGLHTVKRHPMNIFNKMHVNSFMEAVMESPKRGLVRLEEI